MLAHSPLIVQEQRQHGHAGLRTECHFPDLRSAANKFDWVPGRHEAFGEPWSTTIAGEMVNADLDGEGAAVPDGEHGPDRRPHHALPLRALAVVVILAACADMKPSLD